MSKNFFSDPQKRIHYNKLLRLQKKQEKAEKREAGSNTDVRYKSIGKKILYALIFAGVLALLIYAAYAGLTERQKLDYGSHLSDTAVVVDEKELTLRDMIFYVTYEEWNVERQARIYNPDNSRDYWNAHVNGVFIQSDAKRIAMGMAVHDEILYNEASEAGVVLSSDERQKLENRITDFWSDLYDEQTDALENMGISYEEINKQIYRAVIAEKYQSILAEDNGTDSNQYNWNGASYKEMLKDHKVREKRVWERVILGNITLVHGDPNYVHEGDIFGSKD